jgi:hypothetical protein
MRQRAENGDAALASIQDLTGVLVRKPVVYDAENMIPLCESHQSVGRLAVGGLKTALAVNDGISIGIWFSLHHDFLPVSTTT